MHGHATSQKANIMTKHQTHMANIVGVPNYELLFGSFSDEIIWWVS